MGTTIKTTLASFFLLYSTFVVGLAAAQSYPTKPIRFIVPQATGGSNDTMARFMGHHLSERLGKQVVVDNRAGADGIIGTEIAARSTPDGHTWLIASGAYAMNPAVRKVPYDPATAFAWIAMLGTGPSVLVVNPVKAIATGSTRRTPLLPDLPTISESGLPGYESANYWAIATPAGTPPAIINRLSTEVGAILKLPETQKRFTAEGAQTEFKPSTEVDSMIRAELIKWARVAKEARMASEK